MHDTATLVLAILGIVITYTGSIIGLVVWLTGKFRHQEAEYWRGINKLNEELRNKLYQMSTRIQRLELRLFGFTTQPLTGPESFEGPFLDQG